MSAHEGEHWFSRCGDSARRWLMSNSGAPLPTDVFDAVIGAGGSPVRVQSPDGDRSEAFYLHPADSAYVTELRIAQQAGDVR
jgi:hypothetical protein